MMEGPFPLITSPPHPPQFLGHNSVTWQMELKGSLDYMVPRAPRAQLSTGDTPTPWSGPRQPSLQKGLKSTTKWVWGSTSKLCDKGDLLF